MTEVEAERITRAALELAATTGARPADVLAMMREVGGWREKIDRAEAERHELAAQVAAVQALCDEPVPNQASSYRQGQVNAYGRVRAALRGQV